MRACWDHFINACPVVMIHFVHLWLLDSLYEAILVLWAHLKAACAHLGQLAPPTDWFGRAEASPTLVMSIEIFSICIHVYMCGSSLVQLLRSWAHNPRVGGSNPGLGLAVVTLSKSLYPHCSSVPSCKIGTWPRLGWQKKGQNHQSHWQCQEPGEVQVGLWVPTPHQWCCQWIPASS